MANPAYAKDQAKRRIVLKRDIRKAGYLIPADTPTEALELIHALIKARDEVPGIVIVMEGGLIQDVVASSRMQVMVIDYDTEGTTNDITQVDQGDEDDPADAVVSLEYPEVHADYVHGRHQAYRESNGEKC